MRVLCVFFVVSYLYLYDNRLIVYMLGHLEKKEDDENFLPHPSKKTNRHTD
jgi:hypothetical protein